MNAKVEIDKTILTSLINNLSFVDVQKNNCTNIQTDKQVLNVKGKIYKKIFSIFKYIDILLCLANKGKLSFDKVC